MVSNRHLRGFGLLILCSLTLPGFLETGALAQPVRSKVLDRVTLAPANAAGESEIRVGFRLPVRYLSHVPAKEGDLLLVRLAPMVIDPLQAQGLEGRESFSPPAPWNTPLLDILYEGDVPGRPFLIVVFDRRVRFEVRQGGDFRSLVIRVDQGANGPTAPAAAPGGPADAP